MQRINTILILCLPIVAFSSFCFGKEELDTKWPTHYLEGKWYSCFESRIDQNGRIVYEKFGRSLERWSRYDNSGNRVHLKFGASRVFFEYPTRLAVLPKLDYKLDRNGNKKKYAKESIGKESWSVYDNKGIEIYFWDNEGYEKWCVPGTTKNSMHCKDSEDNEYWSEYNSKGKELHYRDSKGKESWYEYDSQGRLVLEKDSRDVKALYEYDSNGNLIYENHGYHRVWYEYDSKGNVTHLINNNSKGLREIRLKNFYKGRTRYSCYVDINGEPVFYEKTIQED
ncbi:MAG: RHS repeat protein [Fibrobacter sp.]|nr:RHS repeat protein [Fibrobacter sp.]